MSLPPPSPHRVEIEHLVRRSIYQRLGKSLPASALAPNPLLVNISARHCHLTPEAVATLLDISEGAVRKHLARARKQLRKVLA